MKAFFNWITRWARTAYEASTSVAFYRRVGERKTGEAVGHLAMLAVLWTLPLTVLFFVGLHRVADRLSEGLRTDIPAGTVFEMSAGKLTNNLQEPLVWREEDGVIIVNTASSTLTLAEGEDGIVIGMEGILQRQGQKTETVSFDEVPAFKVNREELMAQIGRWAPLALFLASLFVLVFVFLAFWAGIALSALLHGFVLWLLLKIVKRPRPWREAFVAAAYAATAAMLLRLVLQGSGPAAILPDIVYWGYVAWIAHDAYKGGTHERKETAPGDRPDPKGESGPV